MYIGFNSSSWKNVFLFKVELDTVFFVMQALIWNEREASSKGKRGTLEFNDINIFKVATIVGGAG